MNLEANLRQQINQKMVDRPDWRYGQAVMNVVYDLYPEVVGPLVGTELDPFYHDSRAEVFLKKVVELVLSERGQS